MTILENGGNPIPAQLELIVEEGFDLPFGSHDDCRVVLHAGLDHDPAVGIRPSRAACNLHEKIERALLSPEVRDKKAAVRKDYPHKLYVWEIEAFGDHLGSNEDVQRTRTELVQRLLDYLSVL